MKLEDYVSLDHNSRVKKYTDELKDIVILSLQREGKNVCIKLKQVDVLELTVRHIHKLSQSLCHHQQREYEYQEQIQHLKNELHSHQLQHDAKIHSPKSPDPTCYTAISTNPPIVPSTNLEPSTMRFLPAGLPSNTEPMRPKMLKRRASDNLPLDMSTAPQHPRMKSLHGSVQLNPSNEQLFPRDIEYHEFKSPIQPIEPSTMGTLLTGLNPPSKAELCTSQGKNKRSHQFKHDVKIHSPYPTCYTAIPTNPPVESSTMGTLAAGLNPLSSTQVSSKAELCTSRGKNKS